MHGADEESQPAGAKVSDQLFSFLLAEALRVEGAFESAIFASNRAINVSATIHDIGLPRQHNQFCLSQVATCYAALGDWRSVAARLPSDESPTSMHEVQSTGTDHQPDGAESSRRGIGSVLVSSGFAARCSAVSAHACSGMHVWQEPPSVPSRDHAESDGAESAGLTAGIRACAQSLFRDSPPIQVSAMVDGAVMHAVSAVAAVFPAVPATGAVPDLHAVVRGLGECSNVITACMQHTPAQLSLAMAAEYMALMHTAAAMAQLLLARMGGNAPVATPSLAQWLQEALVSRDPCQHLLEASALLGPDGDAAASMHMHGLGGAASALLRRSMASTAQRLNADAMHGAGLGASAGSATSASQFPLHSLVFSVACKLASAQEYSPYGFTGNRDALPSKEAALQVRTPLFYSLKHCSTIATPCCAALFAPYLHPYNHYALYIPHMCK